MALTPKQREALRLVSEGKFYPVLAKEEDGWYARWRAVDAPEGLDVDGWVDEYVRSASMTRLTEDAEEQQHESLHDAWMMALKSRSGLVIWDDSECERFAAELEEWGGGASEDVAARKSLVFSFRAPDRLVLKTAPKGRRTLRALGQSTYVWGPLRNLKAGALALLPGEVEDFLQNGAAALKDAGYTIEDLPERARITASAETIGDVQSVSAPVKLVVKVNGEPVTAEEIRFLLEQHSTLVFFREHWIEVDRGILKEALRALERVSKKKVDLLSFAMGVGRIGNLEIEELKAHGWLRGLVNELTNRSRGKLKVEGNCQAEIAGLKGELRPYQLEGVKWIKFLTDHGFGALLADDMGLGKTIQTIAWLLSTNRQPPTADHQPALIIAPLTLLSNWRREFETFAPGLKVYVHQGENRRLLGGFKRAAAQADVVLTSYSLLVKDYTMISEVAWGALVLDEAQAIKNPETQVARAVKALLPPRRLALTGTPIENTVRDVWAIEDFLNPGFLGDRKGFHERFARPIAFDPSGRAAAKLSAALEPFILRRLKTDPEIAAELGEKREKREYSALDLESRRAYEAALASFRATAHTQGDVFALLTELKIICDGAAKTELLITLLEEIFAAGESALIFTQYAKVGARLQAELQKRFAKPIPFLHGALSPSQREREIRRFNLLGPQAFILSLKAGGYGLNLTKATHVIHFDRWWNPAVENQATDRAYRIGQREDVMVHLMISEGTIEERVDELLAKKSSLKDILSDGRAFWEAAKLT